jgi:hypothetical protein
VSAGAQAEPITERWNAYHVEFRRSVGKLLLYSSTHPDARDEGEPGAFD